MTKPTLSHAIVLAATLAAGGFAHAQSQPAETTNTPQRAGEASTMTGGAPNAATSNSVTTDKAKGKTGRTAAMGNKAHDGGKHDGTGKAAAAGTSNTPERAGEASTMTGGAPNAKPTN